ncbi:MAG: prepilin-type N-terminal cleavage/methylation domain-containing protein [Candidatus Binatia bacterium]
MQNDKVNKICALTQGGFSLLELLVVLALLGLGSAIVLPSLERGLKEREVKQSALAVAAMARDLRSRALSEGTPRGLVLNPSENTVRASPGKRILLPQEVKISAIEGGEPMGEGNWRFLFFPNGSTAGGRIGISGGEGSGYTVRLLPLSGRVEVLKGSRQ